MRQITNVYRCKLCDTKFQAGVNTPPRDDMRHLCDADKTRLTVAFGPGQVVTFAGECEFVGVVRHDDPVDKT